MCNFVEIPGASIFEPKKCTDCRLNEKDLGRNDPISPAGEQCHKGEISSQKPALVGSSLVCTERRVGVLPSGTSQNQ